MRMFLTSAQNLAAQPSSPWLASRWRSTIAPLPTLLTALLVVGSANAAEPTDGQAAGTSTGAASAVSGEAIYAYCESCHGKRGAGGEDGKYPRIAGLPADYIDKQLHDFRSQRRVNKPMIPIFKHHRFDDSVIALVSAHIAAMPAPGLSLWPYSPSPEAIDAYGSKPALAAAGAERYQRQCLSCHGDDGAGTAEGPPLIDQYPAYLRKQIADFAAGRREHAAADQCGAPDPIESEALIHHLVEIGKG
jgi:cytochrome c553